MKYPSLGFAAWFGRSHKTLEHCPAADGSTVQAWSGKPSSDIGVSTVDAEATVIPSGEFAKLADSAAWLSGTDQQQAPQASTIDGLSVMRDVLSQEGKSER